MFGLTGLPAFIPHPPRLVILSRRRSIRTPRLLTFRGRTGGNRSFAALRMTRGRGGYQPPAASWSDPVYVGRDDSARQTTPQGCCRGGYHPPAAPHFSQAPLFVYHGTTFQFCHSEAKPKHPYPRPLAPSLREPCPHQHLRTKNAPPGWLGQPGGAFRPISASCPAGRCAYYGGCSSAARPMGARTHGDPFFHFTSSGRMNRPCGKRPGHAGPLGRA